MKTRKRHSPHCPPLGVWTDEQERRMHKVNNFKSCHLGLDDQEIDDSLNVKSVTEVENMQCQK